MAKKKYYAWILPNGESGICDNWDDCQKACLGWRGEKHKSFSTYEEALEYIAPVTRETSVKKPCEVSAPDVTKKGSASEKSTFDIKPTEYQCEPVSDETNQYCKQYGFSHLSDEQKRAVQSVHGKTLLFAVPGSGKTTVLIARNGYLVYSLGISPEEIMSLTFTKAAAREMKERYQKHFQAMVSPEFRTIHSLCYVKILPMLKQSGYVFPGHLLGEKSTDEKDHSRYSATKVFREVFRRIKINPKDFDAAVESVQSNITKIKNGIADVQFQTITIENKSIAMRQVYEAYQDALKERDCLDFDDLLYYSLEGLKQQKDVLASLRAQYKYWSVDEAQDNSPLQFQLIDLICENGNLFMVGDDDQSIYGFRGAAPQLLLEFGNRPDVKTLLMGTNYRSDFNIVNSAKDFIENNTNRAVKEMEARSKTSGEIQIPIALRNEIEQYRFIVEAAKEAIRTRKKLAVLYRRNISSLPLLLYFEMNGIEYEVNKGLFEVLKSKHINNIWKALYFAANPGNYKAFVGCKDYLEIYDSEQAFKCFEKDYDSSGKKDILSFLVEQYKASNVDEKYQTKIDHIEYVQQILNSVKDMTPVQGVLKLYDSFSKMDMENISDRLRLYSLLSACELFDTIPKFVKTLQSIIKKETRKVEDDGELTEYDESESGVETTVTPFVTLSTIHSSKGLEFDRVIILDCFDEIMPGNNSQNDFQNEEERRLFYVAVTRAIHKLDILTVEYYHGNPEKISRFVSEFAFSYACVGDYSEVCEVASESGIESTPIEFRPYKYYAVRTGRIPGIYTTWAECQKQVAGFSNAAFKSFETIESAQEYLGLDSFNRTEKMKTVLLDRLIVQSGGTPFNHSMDLPSVITDAVYEYFDVKRLSELSADKKNKLIEQRNMFGTCTETDYALRTDAYMIAYMPVNFYKIWKPLREVIDNTAFPKKCRVLELGAGPGTATLGLIYFCYLLARDNESEQLSLNITAVEREGKFKKQFDYFTRRLIKESPANLKVDVSFICEDALTFNPGDHRYDLVIESNMLNSEENISDEAKNAFLDVVGKALNTNGYALLVEPGTNEERQQLKKIAVLAEQNSIAKEICSEKTSVNVSGITLCNEALHVGIRYSKKTEHWFNFMVLQAGRN